ncbi:MAG TPA: GntR family transcriptional regulator [Roseomonas sp.]|jgi:DNA-binding GntR family transcriptional regulator
MTFDPAAHTLDERRRRSTPSAAEFAFQHVWRAISHGAIAPGSTVTEEGLAAGIFVSRTPLRDAIRRLETLGLLVREPSRGLRVAQLSMRDMLDLSMTREALEALFAASAAQRVARGEADPAQLRGIHERLRAVQAIGDADLALAVGIDFHEELRGLADNRPARLLHQQVLLAFERYRYLTRQAPTRSENVLAEHAAILEAVEAGDAEAAEARMRSHISAGRGLYTEVLPGLL